MMNNIQKMRKQAKMSQEKLAKALGVSRSTVSMWEISSSEPDNAMLVKLAEIFNVSVDVLLGIDRPEPAPPPEPEIVRAYNDASPEIQAAVRKLLDMDGEKNL